MKGDQSDKSFNCSRNRDVSQSKVNKETETGKRQNGIATRPSWSPCRQSSAAEEEQQQQSLMDEFFTVKWLSSLL